ncbi:MAG TPA: hypothetical protein VEK37_01665, partial [Gemmatimonadaceae bacterium]|nr:hypothetical protein [Gemmatimonadaceae bacterium]
MKFNYPFRANLAPEARLQEVAHEWMEAQRRVGQFGATRYQPEALRFVKCLSGVLDRPTCYDARKNGIDGLEDRRAHEKRLQRLIQGPDHFLGQVVVKLPMRPTEVADEGA